MTLLSEFWRKTLSCRRNFSYTNKKFVGISISSIGFSSRSPLPHTDETIQHEGKITRKKIDKDLNLVRFFWRFVNFEILFKTFGIFGIFFKIFFIIFLRFLGFFRLFWDFWDFFFLIFEKRDRDFFRVICPSIEPTKNSILPQPYSPWSEVNHKVVYSTASSFSYLASSLLAQLKFWLLLWSFLLWLLRLSRLWLLWLLLFRLLYWCPQIHLLLLFWWYYNMNVE